MVGLVLHACAIGLLVAAPVAAAPPGVAVALSSEIEGAQSPAFAAFLRAKAPAHGFDITTRDRADLVRAFARGEVQFALVDLHSFALIETQRPLRVLATLGVVTDEAKILPQGALLAFVRSEDPRNRTLDELRTVSVAASRDATPIWRATTRLTLPDLPAEAVIAAVLDGTVVAGVLTDEEYWRHVDAVPDRPRRLRPITTPAEGPYPFPRSSPLFPRSAFVASVDAPEPLVTSLTRALLDGGGPFRGTAFTAPASYSDVAALFAPTSSPRVSALPGSSPAAPASTRTDLLLAALIGAALAAAACLVRRPRPTAETALVPAAAPEPASAPPAQRLPVPPLPDTERLRLVTSLLESLGHEVRNPLFALAANVDAFEAVFGSRPEYAPFLATWRRQIDRLARLLEEMVDFARPIDEPRVRGRLEPVLDAALAGLSHLAAERGVRIVRLDDPNLPDIRLHVRWLEAALRAILENAFFHSPEDGRIDVRLDLEAEAVVCRVHDRGQGFSEPALRQAFQPFFSTRPGTPGLGLALAHRIILEHDGTITLGNAEDGGAIVAVRLPAADPTIAN